MALSALFLVPAVSVTEGCTTPTFLQAYRHHNDAISSITSDTKDQQPGRYFHHQTFHSPSSSQAFLSHHPVSKFHTQLELPSNSGSLEFTATMGDRGTPQEMGRQRPDASIPKSQQVPTTARLSSRTRWGAVGLAAMGVGTFLMFGPMPPKSETGCVCSASNIQSQYTDMHAHTETQSKPLPRRISRIASTRVVERIRTLQLWLHRRTRQIHLRGGMVRGRRTLEQRGICRTSM